MEHIKKESKNKQKMPKAHQWQREMCFFICCSQKTGGNFHVVQLNNIKRDI